MVINLPNKESTQGTRNAQMSKMVFSRLISVDFFKTGAPLMKWLVSLLLCCALHAQAALEPGTEAPDFTLEAALAGKPFSFVLSEALEKGPVVVYFYPKAFTKGCSIEAKMFAEKDEEFKALGAIVLGISNDDLETLKKFSLEDCGSKFAVGSDSDGKIIKSYDANLLPLGSTATRVSYVITPDRKILYVYQAMSPEKHVSQSLEALRKWKKP
jgi:peroxiredoxin Q/BCP